MESTKKRSVVVTWSMEVYNPRTMEFEEIVETKQYWIEKDFPFEISSVKRQIEIDKSKK